MNCLSTIRWISFFIITESVLFVPKTVLLLHYINKTTAYRVCHQEVLRLIGVPPIFKKLSIIPGNSKILKKYLWINFNENAVLQHVIIITSSSIVVIIIITIKTYVWDPLITKWFFSLQHKSKNENAKSIYLLFI